MDWTGKPKNEGKVFDMYQELLEKKRQVNSKKTNGASPIKYNVPFTIKNLFTSLHKVRTILGNNVSQVKLLNAINFKMKTSYCISLFNLGPKKSLYLDFTLQKNEKH